MREIQEALRQSITEKGTMRTINTVIKSVADFSCVLPAIRRGILSFLRLFSEYSIEEVCHSQMLLNLYDKGCSSDLYARRKREYHCTNFLLNSGILRKGDVVFDIGANVGYYALMESRLVGETGKVYAAEPVSSNFNILRTNIILNNYRNMFPFHVAIGDVNKKRKIHISVNKNLCGFVEEATPKKIGYEWVNMVTLDSFLENKDCPKFLRMDVEGFEYNIVKGGTKTLKGNLKILMEIHEGKMSPQQLKEMFTILESNNFIPHIVTPMKSLPPFCKQFKEYLTADLSGKGGFGLLRTDFKKLRIWLRGTGYNLNVYMEKV